ncbi:hypothetical protein [Desulfovibrio sp.]|uniref:hypothetical protein n=1 Tax=Desulfovibrio sp. TaxID=885 RepID=UPI0030787299
MDMRIDRLWLIMRLAECEAVYRTGRSQEELALLADIWAQDLEGQDREVVGRAFVLHRQESGRFPCPADILRLLPRCRHAERRQDAAALPVETVAVGPRSHRDMARLLLQALRGDSEARNEMQRLRVQ